MRFGVVIAPKIDDWEVFKYAEDLGYDTAWAARAWRRPERESPR